MVQKIYSKMHTVWCTNTHDDVSDLVNHRMVKNTKTWISRERKIIFLRNKKILKLCLRWHILRSYHFVAEVTFNIEGLLVTNNIEKSFNSCDHYFLNSVLRKFGLCKNYIAWIEITLRDRLSCIVNVNCRTTTQYFNLERGAD